MRPDVELPSPDQGHVATVGPRTAIDGAPAEGPASGRLPRHVIVASHRRSGTHLTIDAIANNFPAFRTSPPPDSLMLDHLAPHLAHVARSHGELIPERLERHRRETACVFKSHAHGDIARFFGAGLAIAPDGPLGTLWDEARKIYVYRDGRDVLLSQYHYHATFHAGVKRQTFQEYLRAENNFDRATYDGTMNRVEYWAYHVRSWTQRRDVLAISFENLREDFAGALATIEQHLGTPRGAMVADVRLTRRRPDTFLARWKRRLANRGLRHSSVAFHQGRSGGWRDCFTDDDLKFFSLHSRGLNQELGYA